MFVVILNIKLYYTILYYIYRTALGLYFGAVSFMFLGLCCQNGGKASSSDKLSDFYSDNGKLTLS
mgnify:CR=1 FL=1